MKASDLMKKLENDPEYLDMRKRKTQEHEEFVNILAEDERILIEELRLLGYQINSVWDFVNDNNRYEFLRQFDGEYVSAYPVLVKHLHVEHHSRTREGIIRALTEKKANAVASESLLSEFYDEKDSNIKWVIANALRTVLTQAQKRKHPEYKEVYNGKGKP